jgi:hypothetical protein
MRFEENTPSQEDLGTKTETKPSEQPRTTEQKPSQQILGEMKQMLVDPRTISKMYGQERMNIAQKLLDVRRQKREVTTGIQEATQVGEKADRRQAEILAEQRTRRKALQERQEQVLVHLKNIFGVSDKTVEQMQAELVAIESELSNLFTHSLESEDRLEILMEQQAGIPEPKALLEAYYKDVETTPLTNEEKRELLKLEVLASMTTEEYIKLWRRLNPHFLSHVTRQGFKDKSFQEWQGGVYHQGFREILADRKTLRSLLHGPHGLRCDAKDSVERYLQEQGILEAGNRQDSLRLLKKHFSDVKFAMDRYPDQSSVHLSNNSILDQYYGAEEGNQIFVVYPADVIVSQNAYQVFGKNKTLTRPSVPDPSSDVLVYSEDINDPGISLDAGLVFLPQEIPVDPDTGSKYDSEVVTVEGKNQRVRIEDTELIGKFIDMIQGRSSPIRKAFAEYKKLPYHLKDNGKKDCLRVFIEELRGIGFSDDLLSKLAEETFVDLHTYSVDTTEEQLIYLLKKVNAHWQRPKNTVTAKTYWERYFEKNSDQKPAHVVYYDGDPTIAVYQLLQEKNIGEADTSESDGKLLGFDDHHVDDMKNDPRANVGYDELVATAKKVIDKHYEEHEQ